MKHSDQAVADVDSSIVLKAMEDILLSTPFCTSKQCQDMLRYVIERTLKHDRESLRERVIGVEVFGKHNDYDTSEDPVVRVRAADIRKRLAQYYQNSDHTDSRVRIGIPSGSYVATFEVLPEESISPPVEPGNAPASPEPTPTPTPAVEHEGATILPHRRNRVLWIAAPLIVILLSVIILRMVLHRPSSMLEQFWSPVFASSKPALIYGGANALYRLSNDFWIDTGKSITLRIRDLNSLSTLLPTRRSMPVTWSL